MVDALIVDHDGVPCSVQRQAGFWAEKDHEQDDCRMSGNAREAIQRQRHQADAGARRSLASWRSSQLNGPTAGRASSPAVENSTTRRRRGGAARSRAGGGLRTVGTTSLSPARPWTITRIEVPGPAGRLHFGGARHGPRQQRRVLDGARPAWRTQIYSHHEFVSSADEDKEDADAQPQTDQSGAQHGGAEGSQPLRCGN